MPSFTRRDGFRITISVENPRAISIHRDVEVIDGVELRSVVNGWGNLQAYQDGVIAADGLKPAGLVTAQDALRFMYAMDMIGSMPVTEAVYAEGLWVYETDASGTASLMAGPYASHQDAVNAAKNIARSKDWWRE